METELLRVVSPAPRVEWQDLCDSDRTSVLSQSPTWIDAISQQTRWADASRFYETTDGRAFVLPLVRRGPRGPGAVHASLPAGWGMGGFVSRDPMTPSDMQAVLPDLRRLSTLGIRILPNPLCAQVWRSVDTGRAIALRRYSHVLTLDRTIDGVWNRCFHRTTRQNVRRAIRSELDVERDTTGRLMTHYRSLFERSISRWAEHNHEPRWLARIRAEREDPSGKLENLAAVLENRMVTWVAFHSGEPAAAVIVLRGTSSFSWRAAMHEELGPATRAGHLLQYHAIEEACADGDAYYHFGESGRSRGISTYKERFGAFGYSYPEIRIEHVPFTRTNQALRGAVKRAVGYRPG